MMNNIIQLRRALSIGDEVTISNLLNYTISRIEGYRLFGFIKGMTSERCITNNYKQPPSKVMPNGQMICMRVTHADGKQIQ